MCAYGRKPPETTHEVGYWLGQPFWGLGIATEALRAMIDYIFSETDIDIIGGAARVVNPAPAGAGEVRLPVVGRRPVPRARARRLGAGGPLPAGAADLGLAPRLGLHRHAHAAGTGTLTGTGRAASSAARTSRAGVRSGL